MEGTPWTWATIHPGDCIFIPGGTNHCTDDYILLRTVFRKEKTYSIMGKRVD